MTKQDFQRRLQEVAARVEALLDALLPGPDTAAAPRLAEAMRYAVLNGGKRLRPFLVCESARLYDADADAALRVAAALECVHCYSLVHDDLPAMDDDDLRRGRPTVHRAFDEAIAILAGDALLTLAFAILADAATHPQAAVRCRLSAALAQAAGESGMVGGQVLDLEAEGLDAPAVDDIVRLQRLKTGALFRFALTAGPLLADAGEEEIERMHRLADALGLAFQITDDLLDAEASAEEIGKTPGKDAVAGKATFVRLLGLEGARRKAAELIAQAQATLAPFGAKANALRAAGRFILERRH